MINKAKLEEIKEICWLFVQNTQQLMQHKRYKLKNEVLCKKLKTAGDVYLTYDDSLFQWGCSGFVITSTGIYAKFDFAEPEYVPFEWLAQLKSCDELEVSDKYKIKAKGKLVAFSTGATVEFNRIIHVLYRDIIYVLHK